MAGHTINSGCGYSNQSGYTSGSRTNTHYRGSCCEWCDDHAQGRAIGNIPPVGELNGEACADYMCNNPNYCPGRGSGPMTAKGFSGYNNQSGPEPTLSYTDEDVAAGTTVTVDFTNTCGPFPDTGNCGEAITTFTGTTTGQSMSTLPRKWEVYWGLDEQGIPTMSYHTTAQMLGDEVIPPDLIIDNTIPVDPPLTTTTTITKIPTQTAGLGGKSILPMILIAGTMYWLYTKKYI